MGASASGGRAWGHPPPGTPPRAAVTDLLLGTPLFEGMSAADLDPLLDSAMLVRIDEGAIAFHQGDEARSFDILVAGRLKLTQVTADGNQVILRYISPGEMFGGIAALNGNPFPATAEAVTDSVALHWDRDLFQRHMQTLSRLSFNVLKEVSRRFGEVQARFRELATERVERRVARTLLRLARQAGKRTEKGILIDLPLSRQDLAEMTGTTQFTVSRVLSDWERRDLVEAGRARVVLRNHHALVVIAEDLDPDPE